MRTSDILLLGGFLPFLLNKSGTPNRVGRFRVNFNLNRSYFGPIEDRYYQYGIRDTSGGVNGGRIVHYAERVFLKNVSVWCYQSRWQKFHDRLMAWINQGKNPDMRDPSFIDWMGGVQKDPFCFLEGEIVSGDNMVPLLNSYGFSLDAPTGVASFNPRSPFSMPGFSFSPLDRNEPDVERKYLVGARFALLTNAMSPFPPVYIWDPCLCNRKDLNNPKWAGYSGKVVDTYSMYQNQMCLADNYQTKKIPPSWSSVQAVQQKSKGGKILGYSGPMRQFIPR
jgi:hypothetical protein